MEALWYSRYSDNSQLWRDLLIDVFPDILFLIQDSDEMFGSPQAGLYEVTISSPLVIRDLLLALEESQGYLFIPLNPGGSSLTSYWFYLDEQSNPQVVSLYSEDREDGYFDSRHDFRQAVEDLIIRDENEIIVEEGALKLISILRSLGKRVIPVYEYQDGLYDHLVELEDDEDAMLGTPPSFEEVADGPSVQIWMVSESYPEVALLKTPGKYCLIATVESGHDHIFNYATSSNFDDIYLILTSIFLYG